MKLTVRDPWKPKSPLVLDDVEILRTVVVKRGKDSPSDEYAIVFKNRLNDRQFAITASGTEVAALVSSICTAHRGQEELHGLRACVANAAIERRR